MFGEIRVSFETTSTKVEENKSSLYVKGQKDSWLEVTTKVERDSSYGRNH